MTEHFELPFSNARDLPGMPTVLVLAFWPWLVAGYMMASGMSLWAMAARGGFGQAWPHSDSLDQAGDAPAEELMEHERFPSHVFRAGT